MEKQLPQFLRPCASGRRELTAGGSPPERNSQILAGVVVRVVVRFPDFSDARKILVDARKIAADAH
jgi:hypothetical protein